MIASGAVPALLPAHIGVSQTSQITRPAGTLPTPWGRGRSLSRTSRAAGHGTGRGPQGPGLGPRVAPDRRPALARRALRAAPA